MLLGDALPNLDDLAVGDQLEEALAVQEVSAPNGVVPTVAVQELAGHDVLDGDDLPLRGGPKEANDEDAAAKAP